ncbi:MAG: hypothetical protein V7767_05300, partial [Leeuwenhoekiella sp.]
YLLEHPEQITADQTSKLTEILAKYPYFQPARALYLKGLKNEGSFIYNKELKRTAAHTTDRSILFEFITSDIFNQNEISAKIKQQDESLYNIPVYDANDVSQQIEIEELGKANQVLDPDFFVPKTDFRPKNEDISENNQPDDILEVGKPLDFKQAETHSFTEWLQITTYKPIERFGNENKEEIIHDPERKRKIKLIDRFIAANPKIKVKPAEETVKKTLPETLSSPDETLMTETLARVYVEQKNYAKAKQAYKILSLKYPEKSGFFADRIRAIEKLQDNKST